MISRQLLLDLMMMAGVEVKVYRSRGPGVHRGGLPWLRLRLRGCRMLELFEVGVRF